MVKRYLYKESNSSFFIKVGERAENITFKNYNGGGLFVTTDPELQKGIEADSMFGKDILLEDLTEQQPQEEVTPPNGAPVTEFADVTNAQQAKDVLRAEPYKVHQFSLKTPDAIRKAAETNNVSFPNWND